MDKKPDSPALAAAPAASAEAHPEVRRGTRPELRRGAHPDLMPLPQREGALVPMAPDPSADGEAAADEARVATEPDPALDAHGFDSAAYKWLPVLRRPRHDGWTPQRQRDFIAALADYGCVAQAARAVHMTERSCYRLRRSPGAENFAAAWDAALQHAARKLVDLAFDRAIHGSDEPVFDKHGRRVGRRMRQNDRLLMFLLRAYMPERFRHARRDGRAADEPLPRAEPPVEAALRRLAPIEPAEPHALLPPDELEDALLIADMGTGELPHWHRGRGDAEPPAPGLPTELEALLEEAKHEAAAPWLRDLGGDDPDAEGFDGFDESDDEEDRFLG